MNMKNKLLALALAWLLCIGLAPSARAGVEELISLRVDDVVDYSEEAGVCTVRENGLYGFYAADGSLTLEPEYAAAGPYAGGYAAVSLAGEWTGSEEEGTLHFRGGRFGYVDGDGILVIPMQYRQAFPFAEGRAFAVDASGKLVMLDQSGKTIASYSRAELREGESVGFSDGLAVIPIRGGGEDEERYYLVVDSGGRAVCTLTDAYVDFMGGYHDGLIAVAEAGERTEDENRAVTSGAWGYRDEEGELAIECRYAEAAPFSDGLAAVLVEGESGKSGWGFVSTDGEMVIPAEYEAARSFVDGLGAVCSGGKWAIVDTEGRTVTDFSYEEIGPFREGIALVRERDRLRAINSRGVVLFSVEAVASWGFSGGAAAVRQSDGLYGVCDASGGLLVPFEYEAAFSWDGYLWLKRGELWRVYSTQDVIDARQSTPEGEPAEVGTFLDVPADSWYAAPVTWATDHDVITGTGGGLFSPDRSCTTGEIISFLWRAMGRPEPEIENPFLDVSASHYYYQAALWAYENRLVGGEVFNAAQQCSRIEALDYLWRLAGRPTGYEPVYFTDIPEDSSYAEAIAWAVGTGITGGSGGGAFSPDEICSRGQIVTFLYRYLVGE